MDEVSQIREKIDLVSLISEYIPLKKMGRNFKALCPFHGEKTPSFVVSPERQIWHCFGCSKGGDCYTFLMEYENLEFPEALRILAKKAGIQLRETSSWQTGISAKKEKIYKLNNQAAEFYHYLLTKHNVGKKALEYLKKRQIKPQTISTFKLGFAPRIGNALVNYLKLKKKYTNEDLIEAGLASQKAKEVGDFFLNRLIFPLVDHRGNVIGFSGRVLDDSVSPPAGGSKYVNTRETLVYHKGDVFFGLNIAKDEIKKENRVIVTEGEFDVISSFQEGLKNVVAVKGSALTENQVSLLSRFTQKVSLCFDQDQAGKEALKRSLPILEKKGLTITVVVPLGKDPDETIKKDPLSFKKAVKNDIGIYDFLISQALRAFDKKTIEGKKKIAEELLPLIAGIENEIIKEHYLKILARELETSYESIAKEAQRVAKKELLTQSSFGQKIKKGREEVLEEYLLALILQAEAKTLVLEKASTILLEFLPKERACQKILERLFGFLQTKEIERFSEKRFFQNLPEELLSAFNTSFLFPLPTFETPGVYLEEAEKVAKELKTLYLKAKIKAVGTSKDKEFTHLLRLLQEAQNNP